MDARLLAAVTSSLVDVNVSELCRRHRITPKTFYKWRKRYEIEGLAGLYERSRRPHRLANQLPGDIDNQVVNLRQELSSSGLDAGPLSIQSAIASARGGAVPSEATIWRILKRKGLISPQPAKRPKSSYVRFEAELPNECWQIDATEWTLAGGRVVSIINIVDDHSRMVIRSAAVSQTTSIAAWDAFCHGIRHWGLPSRCLSDNGLAFSGKLKNFEVFFEKQLRQAGILPITARPYHPQTCGKVERFQQTLKKWLRLQPTPTTIAELQNQLDRFSKTYNFNRPHQSIGRTTPHARWSASAPATNSPTPLPPNSVRLRVTGHNGRVSAGRRWSIGIGSEFNGKKAEVVITGYHAAVFVEGRLVRTLELDPTRRYQPTGLSSGRRTRSVS